MRRHSPAEVQSPPSSGFVAYLEHASLKELLQLESRSQGTGVFGVTSGTDTGYLHVEAGEIIHAEAGPLEGEEALFHILSWNEGRFAQCPLPLSRQRTVDKSLELLLLMQTKRNDESANSGNNLKRQYTPTDDLRPPLAAIAVRENETSNLRARRAPLGSSTDVVLSPEGELLHWHGRSAQTFATQVAYATRLGNKIGTSIGSGQPIQLELRGTKTRTVIVRLPEGSLAASRLPLAPHERLLSTKDTAAFQQLMDVEGVYGTFVVNRAGQVLHRNLSVVVNSSSLSSAGTRIAHLWSTLPEDEVPQSALFEFKSHKLLIQPLKSGSLCVLVSSEIQLEQLLHAASSAARFLDQAINSMTPLVYS